VYKKIASEDGILTKGAMESMSIVEFGGGDRQFVNAVDKNLWEYVECKCDGGAGPCEGFMGFTLRFIYSFRSHVWRSARWTLKKVYLNVKSIALRNSPRVSSCLQRVEIK